MTASIRFILGLLGIGILASFSPVSAAVRYTLKPLQGLDRFERVEVVGINDLGDIAGQGFFGPGVSPESQAFIWRQGEIEILPAFSPTQSEMIPSAINNLRQVVGYASASASPEQGFVDEQGFLWDPETGLRPLLPPPEGTGLTLARSINNSSVVVGTFGIASGGVDRPFIWDEELGMRSLGDFLGEATAIDENGTIAGFTREFGMDFPGPRPFVWTQAEGRTILQLPQVGDLPIAHFGLAFDINATGQVVGTIGDQHSTRPVLWQDGAFHDLPGLGGNAGQALAINDQGMAVGFAVDPEERPRALLWPSREELVVLPEGVEGAEGWLLVEAVGINQWGAIIGHGVNPDGEEAPFFLVPDDAPAPAGLVNIATRGRVGSGHEILIGGFVVDGELPGRFLIRGIGPGLSGQGLPAASLLADPVLHVFRAGTAEPILSNSQWTAGIDPVPIELAAERVGAPALARGSQDAVIYDWLEPGVYTVHLVAGDAGSGIALIEIFSVPPPQ